MQITQIVIANTDQIIFNRPNSLVICRVVSTTEKAVKVDYEVMPITMRSGCSLPVYQYACWIPKSVIILDERKLGYTVKQWFANNFQGGKKIKKYMVSNDGTKITV